MRTLDNSPLWLKWIAKAAGWLVAVPWYAFAALYRLTLRVEVQGQEHLGGDSARVIAFWHCNLGIWFHVFLRARGREVWMQHPALFMTAIHAMLRLMGVRKLAFGSTGNAGKAALNEVTALLKEGYSTIITPDGPRGPVRQLKPGVLIMSADSGVPVVAVSFRCDRCWRLSTWDRKVMPMPFSRVRIRFHPPLHVTDPMDTRVAALLCGQMD
jgi:lysophospholipid acyltransferase (LPLAT)-like uncharacterized protein